MAKTARVWKSEREVQAVARALNRMEEDGWSYTVVKSAGEYRICVCDETGAQLGYL